MDVRAWMRLSPLRLIAGPLRRMPVRVRMALAGGVLVTFTAAAALIVGELRTSRLQARYFASLAAELTYDVRPGPSDAIRFPDDGPYDLRFGYARLPRVIDALTAHGFTIDAQAHGSARLLELADRGLYPIYPGKSQAGLWVRDRRDLTVYDRTFPRRVFTSFDSIAPAIWRTVLFMENRALLDARFPRHNPAVEWQRLARSSFELGLSLLGGDGSVSGASTLATQLEKFRHSPEGRTASARGKLRQMYAASLRSYLDGERTLPAQRRIIVDYLNSVPLAGIAGHGEVIGLGDGLWAWYGADAEEVNDLLRGPAQDTAGAGASTAAGARDAVRRGVAYRQVLSLFLAHRRPSWLLVQPQGREALARQTDDHLRMLVEHGVITAELRDAALSADIELRTRAPATPTLSFVDRKGANAVRNELMALTGVRQLYELDRFDLTVRSTLDLRAQEAVTELLQRLKDPVFVRKHGLDAFRMLDRGDPAGVVYAFALHERTPWGNAVRVQADNLDAPFGVGDGAKLELGSTAKLRTVITYLETVELLHRQFAGRPAAERGAASVGRGDHITTWALDFLALRPDASLVETLDAAMQRYYSASPAERFFTRGGVHTFRNFDAVHDSQFVTVRDALVHSVNLPFIRLLRDIVQYHVHRLPGQPAAILTDRADPRREEYLERFADSEGRVFLDRFLRKYVGLDRAETLAALVGGRTRTANRLAWAFRSVLPEAGPDRFAAFLHTYAADVVLADAQVLRMYERSDPAAQSLADRGYLAGVHPLELWLVAHLLRHPGATRAEVMEASGDARQEVYGWLFSTQRTAAQDQRIRSILEAQAFLEIHRSWRRLGYPFESLVPSYATAIGSSADRPNQLAELVGILLNEGVRSPVHRVRELHFAAGTPFETRLSRRPAPRERVLSAELAAVVRSALVQVVERGTARRAAGAVRAGDGSPLVIGAKTGTGNNRFSVVGADGRLIEDRTVNRTSALVFFLGDRFYGTITAFVPGPTADDYRFTSSLPAQILRLAAPTLQALVDEGGLGLVGDNGH